MTPATAPGVDVANVYARVHAIVRRKWGAHPHARDAASEAFVSWLANPADKGEHASSSHVHFIVLRAGETLSPTGRRAAGRRLQGLAGRFEFGVDGPAGPAEDAWRAAMHGVAGGAVRGEQEDATIAAVDLAASLRARSARPVLAPAEWAAALARLRADGWTQAQIAHVCGVTVSMAGKWLRGAAPRPVAQAAIARAASTGNEPPVVTSRQVERARAVARTNKA